MLEKENSRGEQWRENRLEQDARVVDVLAQQYGLEVDTVLGLAEIAQNTGIPGFLPLNSTSYDWMLFLLSEARVVSKEVQEYEARLKIESDGTPHTEQVILSPEWKLVRLLIKMEQHESRLSLNTEMTRLMDRASARFKQKDER